MLAMDHENARPDILILGKALSGGTLPVSAVLADDEIMLTIKPGEHGSTYGGNPLACAAGARVMEIIAEPAFLAEVNRKAGLLRQRLEGLVAAHPEVFEGVRGTGLMLGLKCRLAPADLVKAGYAEHVLTVAAADNTLRLLPPLTITDDEIVEAVHRLDLAAARLEG